MHGVTKKVKIIADMGSWEWLPETGGPAIRYTAPDTPGFYRLTFYQTDKPLDTRLVHVKVYCPLEIVTPLETSPEQNSCSSKKPSIFLEDYETKYLQVKCGVPPYLWIEGGKGEVEYLGTARNKIRYKPGRVIGPETLSIYDSTNSSVDVRVTVKGNLRVSPIQHSVCLDNATVKFQASGGECPYKLAPPSQGGYHKINSTQDSMTLKFTQTGKFELVASDEAGDVAIASVTVATPPCHCEDCLTLEPAGPLRYYVPKDGIPSKITVLVTGKTTGAVKWLCQGACDVQDLNVTTGKEVTLFSPKQGNYELIAQDQSGRTGSLKIHIASDIVPLYIGPNGILEPEEMQQALNDFFTPDFCCSRNEFYRLTE